MALIEAVGEVARLVGDAVMRHYRQVGDVHYKADRSLVTAADLEGEHLARDWINDRFPQDGIFGEELGAERPDAPRTWLIDPIDGTVNFVHGVPLFGVLVAVVEGDEVLAGAINCAGVGELAVAERGSGAWLNGERCAVSKVDQLSDALVLTTDEQFGHAPDRKDAWERVASRAHTSRSWGDCYGYLLVASGRAEVMADGIANDWDLAAPMIVVEEAGGRFTDWTGARTRLGKSGVATNAALADPVRALLSAT